jgi:undecaprenyl-diphosphatase
MASLDHRIVAWMSGLDLPLVTPLAKSLSAIGSSGLIFVVIAAAVSARRRSSLPVVLTLLAVIVSDPLSRAMKGACDRPRPSVAHADVHALVAVPGNASMPSGHAWISFACAIVLGGLAPRLRPWLLGLAFVIALTRVYLGVHYPSDVIVGAAGGAATGGAVLLALWLVHAQVGTHNHRDGGDQRQPDPEGRADRGVDAG